MKTKTFPGDDTSTISEGKAWIREEALKRGGICPCCMRLTRFQRYGLGHRMARELLVLYRRFRSNNDWLHAPNYLRSLKADDRDTGALVKLGLLEAKGRSSGIHRMTQLGLDFAGGKVSIPKWHYEYNGNEIPSPGGKIPNITIFDAIPKTEYAELVNPE